METEEDLLLSIGLDWSLNAVVMMESDRANKRIWRALGLRFKNINVVIKRYRMSSLHMHQLGKNMVKRNI